jgi:hypothetical protein
MKKRGITLLLLITGATLILLGCAAELERRAHSGYRSSPLRIATATPVRAQLEILELTRVPSVTADLFTATPVGEEFLLVTLRLANDGQTALRPTLIGLVLEDAAGRQLPRAPEAEFILRTAGEPVLSDRPIPPGVRVEALVVFEGGTAVAFPLRLLAHLPEQTLTSDPYPGE